MRGAALAAALLLPAPAAAEDRVTGYDMLPPELRAMQDDPVGNPGLFWVLDGAAAWERPPETGAPSCAGCHGDAAVAMAGVAARYPAWDEASARPVDLAGRIDLCRVRHQEAPPLGHGSDASLALAAFVTQQSREMPIAPGPDPRLDPARKAGEALFRRRVGQLNLSCAQCHDERAGGHLAAATIPEAHPTGYPQYRLEWETMGSLHRRFGNCLFGVRADPLAPGGDEAVALELYLKTRAAGLPVESPAIRP